MQEEEDIDIQIIFIMDWETSSEMEQDSTFAYCASLEWSDSDFHLNGGVKYFGFNIRCVKVEE